MDPRLLNLYNRELQYVRELGAEFAREYPQVAGRLGIEAFECADPYVERLLEGFAFLAARVQLKIDAGYSRFTQHLLDIVYPQYLAPTPSMAVVQLQPNLAEGSLAQGYRVPRGSALRTLIGRGEQTPCEYRTGHEVTLWPLEIARAEYTGYVGDLSDIRLRSRPRAALRVLLRATAGLKIADLTGLDELTLFIRGSDELPMRIYEQLLGHTVALIARAPGRPPAWQEVVERPVVAVGFEDDEALLRVGPRSFAGYRLLHEYFAFPARYLFVKLTGLRAAAKRATGTELELVIVSDLHERTLDGAVAAEHLALHCTPAVNLFPRRADRIHLTEGTFEYHVIPDRTRPMDFEVHAITEVGGYGVSADLKQTFEPFFAWNHQTSADAPPAYFTVQRQPRALSAKQRLTGPRSSYVGSEVFVSLVDPNGGPYRSQLKQLAVEVTCTNRDLPLHIRLGQGRTDFTLDAGAPIQAIRCVAGPTPPRVSHGHGDTAWRLISHLSLNYLSLLDVPGEGHNEGAAALRELLSLYADLTDPAYHRQIEGVRSTAVAPITRPLPIAGPTVFGRGLEITVSCDDGAFEGTGIFLLGAVLERFFAKYVSINSFTETVLRSVQRGEVMRWPTRTGRRHTV